LTKFCKKSQKTAKKTHQNGHSHTLLSMDPTADQLIRDSFSNKKDAIAFFSQTLPANIVEALDMPSLQVLPTSMIDENLKELQSDLLFEIKTKAGRSTKIYLLFEHKSRPDRRIFTQLLSYLARIYAGQKEPVPIIPFVFYHNKWRWKLGHSFIDHFRFDKSEAQLFGRYLPNFQFQFFDLKENDFDQMELFALFHFTLKILRSIDRQSLVDDFASHLAGLKDIVIEENVMERFRKIIYYISKRGNLAAEEIIEHIEAMPQPLTEEAMNAYDELIERGRKQGRKEVMSAYNELIERGYVKGLEEGRKEVYSLLLKQLERRFTDLTTEERTLVENCKDQSKLESASLALVDGKSKEEVLAKLSG